MSKRFSDTEKLDQLWLKRLKPEYKLIWMYLELACDHAGIWKIDVPDLKDKTGIEKVNIKEFVKACNQDFDKLTGDPISRERIIIVRDSHLWITGFIQFQYERKDKVLPDNNIVISAIEILKSLSLLNEAINKGFINPSGTLRERFAKGRERVKDKDKDKSNKEDSKKNESFHGIPATPEDIEEVIRFFENMKSSEAEAKSFFYHYESQKRSNGRWEKSSGMIITSWRQAAKKWIHESRTRSKFMNMDESNQPIPQYLTNRL